MSWNNFWDVRISSDHKEWYLEMRMPFTSLQFQVVDGKIVMGVSSFRYIASNKKFTSNLLRMKGLYMFSTKLSLAAFLQYNSDIKSFLGNIRFRYNPSERNDLYIVNNGDTNFDLLCESSQIPRFSERTVLVKYSYTFSL